MFLKFRPTRILAASFVAIPLPFVSSGCSLEKESTQRADLVAPPAVTTLAAPIESANGAVIDPALVRVRLLERWDAEIDQQASLAHLRARLICDEILPIPYLGIDADPADDGLRITHVYPLTAAERSGLLAGDLLLSVGGAATQSKAGLGTAVRCHGVSDVVELVLRRDGKEMRLSATLGGRPEEDEDEEEQFPGLRPPRVEPTEPLVLDFEKCEIGECPTVLEQLTGGHGKEARYVVREANGGRVLRQESDDPTGIHFPLAIARDFRARNVEGRGRFRFVGGRIDKAGGIVLRYHDPLNYLVARANAAEGDLRIFRVANGVRNTLPDGIVKVPCDDDAWHEIVFRANGTALEATFDGKYSAKTHDAWFLDGRVGVWTKSDSITEFDDLRFTPTVMNER